MLQFQDSDRPDRRCVACGDDADTRYARIYDGHYQWICWNSFACEARLAACDAHMDEQWALTAAGQAAKTPEVA